jgi:sulfur carrier protein ThiS
MKRTFAILNPVQFTPGEPAVMIPVQQVAPSGGSRPLEAVNTTRDKIVTDDAGRQMLAAFEGAIVTEAQAELAALYEGDDIEVLTQAEWQDRQAAAADAAVANQRAAAARGATRPVPGSRAQA